VGVQQALPQEEAAREAGEEGLPERGSPVEAQLKLCQEESWAGARKRPGECWAEARKGPEESWAEARERPEAEMEKACGKTGGNGEREQESCGNGDKRPAGIAASREEREDLVREVEVEGNEDGPQYETRSQAGHPVPVGHESCRQRAWEPGKLHSKLREKKELEPSGNFSSFDAATGRRTDRGSVSPAYGYIRSAPIKCSNDGGPGPRHTMKKDPGYSIFSMPVVYGYYLHLLTSSEKRVIGRISENPLPPFKPPWAEPPSLPPGVRAPPPANRPRIGRPQRNRTSASDSRSEAAPTSRGGCGDHFGLFGAPVRGQAAELEASAG
jgi:hypothetical protein